jgi:hypothetical protein
MKVSFDKGVLTIVVACGPEELKAATPSSTGKSLMVDSTHGYIAVPGVNAKFSLNVITPPTAK